MGINKVQINRNGQTETIIDLTQDTVTEETLLDGVIAHGADGEPIIGTFAPKLQDKTITENGTYQAESDYDGLGSVTVDVASSLEGLENGYDVMFYDENNEGLAFYSIKQGQKVMNAPDYIASEWRLEDGTTIEFPYVPTSDLNVYAYIRKSWAKQLYEHYNIDPSVYPYLAIYVYKNKETKNYFYVAFGSAIATDGRELTAPTYIGAKYKYSSVDYYDVDSVMNWILSNVTVSSQTYGTSNNDSSDYYYYTNYDIQLSNATLVTRID